MDIVDKYLVENKVIVENKVYKSFTDRIKRAGSSKDISKVLQDVKKALNTKDIDQKEAIKLADLADDKLEDI